MAVDQTMGTSLVQVAIRRTNQSHSLTSLTRWMLRLVKLQTTMLIATLLMMVFSFKIPRTLDITLHLAIRRHPRESLWISGRHWEIVDELTWVDQIRTSL